MTRLAIVGIDGATFKIIQPMVEEGQLPHIGRILREGVSGSLESEKPPITPPAWASMMTGLNPGRHGIYHFVRRELGTYEARLVDSRNFAGKDLMSILTRRGWTCGNVNVPMTYPPFPVEGGYMISGIPCPLEGNNLAWPSNLMAELEEFLGRPYRPDVDYAPFDGDRETTEDDLDRYAQLRDELFEVEYDRLKVMKEWIRRHPTDLCFTVTSLTDRIQHNFWKFQDPAHPGYTEEGARRYGEVIRDSYRVADEFVGAMRESVGEDVPILILSDHGFGNYTHDFHLNNWLEEAGLLVRRKPPYWPLVRPKRKREADIRDVDWSRTKAFSHLHGVCVNLKGREPQGMVEPGEGFRRTIVEIEQELQKIESPEGRPAVDYTARADHIYHGPHAQEAPDLQFQLMDLRCVPKDDWDGPSVFQSRKNAMISGQHRFEGIFGFWGPEVAAGRVIEEMHIQDSSPTLLHAIGEPISSWMEGKVRTDVFQDPRPPEYDQEEEPVAGAGLEEAFSDDQAAAIEESLRGLGYLQ